MVFAPHQSAMVWPQRQLSPARVIADVTAFTRSGGPSLTNLNPAVRTDRGSWKIELSGVYLATTAQRRVWDAIATYLSGRSGLIAVPVFSFDANPFVSGDGRGVSGLTNFSGGATFSDGSSFAQRQIAAKANTSVALSATTIEINVINAAEDMSGVRFSYAHAPYKTGRVLSKSGNVWTVEITPAVRKAIPAGAELNFDNPTCLSRLADDSGMRRSFDTVGHDAPTVSFVEATDYWSDLAIGVYDV